MKTAIMILLWLSAAGGADEAAIRVGICDILREPAKWNGKMIEVSGPIMPVQNYWVMGIGCDGALRVKGTTFLSGFVLQSLPDRSYDHKVQFSWNEESKSKLDALTQEAERTKRRVLATVVGRFETLDPIEGLIDESAPYKYRGFGHMGVAPGQIIVKTVKNMRTEENDPTAKK